MAQTCPQCQSKPAMRPTTARIAAALRTAAASGQGAPTAGPAPAVPPPRAAAPPGPQARRPCRPSSSTPPAGRSPIGSPGSPRSCSSSASSSPGSVFLRFRQYVCDGLWHGWMWLSHDPLDRDHCLSGARRAGWDRLPISQTCRTSTVMMIATIVNVVLVLIAFIDKPGGSGIGWGFGAIVGLIAALVAAAPSRFRSCAPRRCS